MRELRREIKRTTMKKNEGLIPDALRLKEINEHGWTRWEKWSVLCVVQYGTRRRPFSGSEMGETAAYVSRTVH
jgi:hypothetical protein